MNAKETTPVAFRFSATSQEVRSLLIENEPWLVAKDVCDVLEISDTTVALRKLDDDEKLTRKIYVSGQNRKMWLVNESGLYALIIRSNKPEAKTFRKWVTSEVLPSIRKKGYYLAANKQGDFLDMRDIPPTFTEINRYQVCTMPVEGEPYYSVNDIHRAIHSATSANQAVKKLNAKRPLAVKVYVFGATHPAWFTNGTGLQLLVAGSRIVKSSNQLSLTL